MNSIVLLILIINGSAAVYETHSMQECQQIKEYIIPQLDKKFKRGTYGATCLYKMGGYTKQTKY